jgi:phenylacetate-CoA ligase
MGLTDRLFRDVIWPMWLRRDDPRTPGYLRELERRRKDTPEVVAARQAVRLRRLACHAVATVPYYRDLFRAARIDPARFAPSDLLRLPTLSKTTIRERGDELISSAYRGEPLISKKTSGSTGVPLRVRIDEAGMAWKRAATLLADEDSGWRRGGAIAKAWGNPEYKQFGWRGWLRNTLYERAMHLDTLKMDSAAIDRFVDRLIVRRPALLFGHAHSVYLVAHRCRERGIAPPAPAGIITTAMVLHGFERQLIESVFRCPVTNRYGCEEVSLIACECPAHDGLHINVDSVFVEVLAGDRPAAPGQPGDVVITDLSNFAMPLVRYRVGDVARWSAGECACGRAAPKLATIEGREADYVVTPSGHYISGISLTENFATLVPGIAQLQIVQEKVDFLRFRIVRASDWTAGAEAALADMVRERFGPVTRYECEFVDAIEREPSGKYRFCISQVLADVRRGQAA